MKINLPVDIIFGSNLHVEAAAVLADHKFDSVYVLTGAGSARESGLLERLCDELKKQGMTCFDGRLSAGPDSDAVDKLAGEIAASKVDAVLALGGGSVIDAAKSAALQAANGCRFSDIEFNTADLQDAVPVIAAPTVSGSGSEVTPYAVINNSKTGRKSTISHNSLFPETALICPEVFTSVSSIQTIAGSFDALIHCFEAYTSTRSNELANAFAVRGAYLIFDNLKAALSSPEDVGARKALAEASMFGGIAITHARTGAIHTLSAALQKYTQLPHGLLNAALLPAVTELNENHYSGKVKEFMSACGFSVRTDAGGIVKLAGWISQFFPPVDNPFDIPGRDAYSIIERFKEDKGLLEVNPAPLPERTINAFITGIIDA
ncbi:iron-containing alcohol dehydrogenase [Maridesulfovibrio hydrothermalis]|uniref:Putative Alcohol dehydrogenase, iron-type n=1 Tax=Maridesulfovibrio hydrothermalis AM13 = DSM 14728 TaxID=1121451 RepID=L0RA08_9BACT|nr:iron-containing alcohol dehydrogenase [Maridesulfovibrio hydrothermalis]CCO23589.1 putative Alcohol dehydrogenase, iron-type [Maridesulfovibrio hydrothermalis AM13 = DSM 14728]